MQAKKMEASIISYCTYLERNRSAKIKLYIVYLHILQISSSYWFECAFTPYLYSCVLVYTGSPYSPFRKFRNQHQADQNTMSLRQGRAVVNYKKYGF